MRVPREVSRDGAGGAVVDSSLQSSADGGRQGDEYDLVALAAYAQHAVTVFLAEVLDVAAGGLEDP
jgi:hypothetical protein